MEKAKQQQQQKPHNKYRPAEGKLNKMYILKNQKLCKF